MPRPATDKRQRLTAAAATLVREHGMDGATIAAIADAAGVAPGSVYYYFKSKDEVAQAVADAALSRRRAELAEWSESATPADRLRAYVAAMADRKSHALAGDTSVGLALLLRTSTPNAAQTAADVVRETTEWAATQYTELGFAGDAAAARALHLVTGIEGAAALAHATGDPTTLDREAAHLSRWIGNAAA